MHIIQNLLNLFQSFGNFGYFLALFISLAESIAFIGMFVPGATFLAFAGFLSAKGIVNPILLAFAAAVGAVIGDGISYFLGTKGTRFFKDENRILKTSNLERGQKFFKTYGEKSILLGRFIGPIRPIIPFVAGVARMDRKRFFLWNIISAILWGAGYVSLGYFFGSSLPAIHFWIKKA